MSTIVALSTPRGPGALSVIRLSGPDSVAITRILASDLKTLQPRTATLTRLRDPASMQILDEVIVTHFAKPHSLTGEDVVEISCHGSPSVVRQIIDLVLTSGARAAGPGEFSLRALTNGKMNLAQAEAVRDLINAQTECAARQAALQLNGELSRTLEPLKSMLIEVIVLFESALEFVEDDLPEFQRECVAGKLSFVRESVEKLSASYSSGHLLRDGIQVTITGKPNVGKSSVFNRLVERDRAIVTAVPGTTRDTLSETINIGGVPIVLTDTAGMRETNDDVESIGIARARQALTEAEVVLNIIDLSAVKEGQLTASDPSVVSQTTGRRELLVLNKIDLITEPPEPDDGIRISAKTGEGFDELKAAILHSFSSSSVDTGGLLITNARHYDLLKRILLEIDLAQGSIADRRSEEITLVHLHNVLRLLGEITGETTAEDILSEIFATFCIGK